MKTEKELSIYIHIPFCVRKCLYCDFLSAPSKAEKMRQYVEALCLEIQSQSKRFSEYKISTIFFGGGTPSLMETGMMTNIMDTLRQNYRFESEMEITVECNPKTLTKEKITEYVNAGVNRISIGLQSADEKELKTLGRIHSYADFLETYHLVRAAGIKNVNIDIMSALPGQTKESYHNTLQKVIALSPEHISAYSLILEEGTEFYRRYVEGDGNQYNELPGEEDERDMYYDTNASLQSSGFTQYEISNYAKTGYACKHNLVYWTLKDYVGFGTGAASYVNGIRYKNRNSTEQYIGLIHDGRFEALIEEKQVLSTEEKMEEYLFVGLRLNKGVSLCRFETLFGSPMQEVYQDVLPKLLQEKLLILQNDNLMLSDRGRDISNYVMAQFLFDH